MREAMRKLGMEAKAAVGKAPVEVGLSNEKGYPHEGVLDFVDNDNQRLNRNDRHARDLQE